MLINTLLKTINLSICNIYAPNVLAVQQKFAQTLKELLMFKSSLSNVIIGGDWNVTLQAIDKQGGIQWKPTAYRYQITSIMEQLDLRDVFRKKYPDKKSFTYESVARKLKSRIDFFLVAKSIACQVVEVGTKTSIAPDHKAVKLRFNLINRKRGPGLWKFNNSLLKDETYVNLISDSYPDIIQKYSRINDPKLKWELIKMEIRGLTIPYSKNKARKIRKTENELEKHLETLSGKIDRGEDTTDSEQNEYEHLKTELRHIYDNRAEGAIFCSKVRWIQEGEKPTQYFFNMERKNFNKKIISELTVADSYITVNESQILEEIKLFYENLYTSSVIMAQMRISKSLQTT